MKKVLLFATLFIMTAGLMAQQVLFEDFSAGEMPPQGWSIDAQASNWSVSSTPNAGGSAPEGQMSWSPQFNTTTRLISPSLDLAGSTKVLLQFRQMIDHYSGSYQIGVATRSSNGAWAVAWSRTISASVSAEQVSVVMEDANVNSTDFQFCIYFSGSSYNLNDWFIDDISLVIPANTDAAVTHINVPTYFTGPMDVATTVTNLGLSPLTSLKLNWQVDDLEVHTASLGSLNVALGQTISHTFTDQLEMSAGIYNLRIWVSEVNGSTGSDDVAANDTLAKIIRIPTQTLPRKPFFEEFTSSTCGPCASFNNSVLNPFVNQHGEEIVLVKYQMNWPGSGDPYYTAEGGSRRNYYGVNAVPMLFVDGKNVATSSPGVNTAFNNSIAKPAFVAISGQYTITGAEVGINAEITSYTDIDNATLHVVIFEGITTENKRTNGETEFHHVMMRLLPDGNGSLTTLQTGVPVQINHLVDMSGTNVEETEDLFVAIFLQDNVTKEVFQAEYATLTGALIATYPANSTVGVQVDEPLTVTFSQPVRLSGGEELTAANASTVLSLERTDNSKTPVEFTAEVSEDKTVVTLTPAAPLSGGAQYTLTVLPLENYSGMATHTCVTHFITETTTGTAVADASALRAFPNPAGEYTEISGLAACGRIYDITLTDLSGKEIRKYSVPASGSDLARLTMQSVKQGSYLIRIRAEKGNQALRLVVLN